MPASANDTGRHRSVPHNGNLINRLKGKYAICISYSLKTGEQIDSSITCVGITNSPAMLGKQRKLSVLPSSFCQNSL